MGNGSGATHAEANSEVGAVTFGGRIGAHFVDPRRPSKEFVTKTQNRSQRRGRGKGVWVPQRTYAHNA